MRCKFEIIEKDGARWAWCAKCNHGYQTEQLDAAVHHRECRPKRGVAGKQAHQLEQKEQKSLECPSRGLKIGGVMVEACCGKPAWKMPIYSCSVKGACTKDQQVEGATFCADCSELPANQSA